MGVQVIRILQSWMFISVVRMLRLDMIAMVCVCQILIQMAFAMSLR